MSLLRRSISGPLVGVVILAASILIYVYYIRIDMAKIYAPKRATGQLHTLFQYSTIGALRHGLYDGELTIAELGLYGDTGLGVFNRLDGVLVALDGAFYQVKSDGRAYSAEPDAAVPFAMVSVFEDEFIFPLPPDLDFAALIAFLERSRGNANFFQAYLIDGDFPLMRVRSVPPQSKPYRPLAEAVAEQVVLDLANVKGTLVGFRMPDYMDGLSVAGYHFHFLTEDRGRGGHVLDLATGSGVVRMDVIDDYRLVLPGTPGFAEADLAAKRKAEPEVGKETRE